MKRLFGMSFALLASAAVAGPAVEVLSVSQNVRRAVVVEYRLTGGDAIVTASFETNAVNEAQETVWAPIAGANVKSVSGDVNAVVTVGTHAFTWKVTKDWPGRTIPAGGIRVKLTARSVRDPADYLVIDLEKTEKGVFYYETADDVPGGVTDDAYKTTKVLLKRIRAANTPFRMGATCVDEKRVLPREQARVVTLTEDYYMGVYEFTQKQYELVAGFPGSAVVNATPSASRTMPNAGKRPVTNIQASTLRGSGADYVWPGKGHLVDPALPLGLLRTRYGFDFDLPTSAQWEYAAAGGVRTDYISGAYSYDGDNWGQENSGKMDDYSWSMFHYVDDDSVESVAGGIGYAKSWYDAASNTVKSDNRDNVPHVVGKLRPNNYGLYDIFGNVNEICLDWFWLSSNDYDCLTDLVDPKGPPTAPTQSDYATQTMGGGSCIGGGQAGDLLSHRISARFAYAGTLGGNGFRLCCPAVAH